MIDQEKAFAPCFLLHIPPLLYSPTHLFLRAHHRATRLLRGEIYPLYLLSSENSVKLHQFGFLRALYGEIFVFFVLFVVRLVFFFTLCPLG